MPLLPKFLLVQAKFLLPQAGGQFIFVVAPVQAYLISNASSSLLIRNSDT